MRSDYRDEEPDGFKEIADLTNIGLSPAQVERLKASLLTSQLFGTTKQKK
jgi:hypothetical protein